MITFNVFKETYGWSVGAGTGMKTPYWSRDRAISRAQALATAIRRHGQAAEVVVGGHEGELDYEAVGFADAAAKSSGGAEFA